MTNGNEINLTGRGTLEGFLKRHKDNSVSAVIHKKTEIASGSVVTLQDKNGNNYDVTIQTVIERRTSQGDFGDKEPMDWIRFKHG